MSRRTWTDEEVIALTEDDLAAMTEEDAVQLIQESFPFFCLYFVKIRDKDGNIVRLRLNKAQMKLWKTIRKLKDEPARIVILKARQLGMSTAIGAYFLWKAITRRGTAGIVVAHKEDPAAELFGKIELAYRKLPPALFGELEAIRDTQKKGKKLGFAGDLDTLLYVDTAGNEDIGRSQNFQMAHLSESAFYKNPHETIYGLNQSIGKRPGTLVIHESTANGLGNYFHELWDRASKGDGTYVPMFFPWTDEEEYRIDPPDGWKPTKAERRLAMKHNLDHAQLYWRRLMIEDECDGDEEKFRQEYPLTPEEAFLVTGLTYFNPQALEYYSTQAKAPKREGLFVVEGGQAIFTDQTRGPWRIYVSPADGHQYIVAADVAGGTSKDYSAVQVIDAESLEQVATFRGKLDPDEFANELKWIAMAYNNALIAPEKNGEGRACLLKLYKDLGYSRIFYHLTEESWTGSVANAYGWVTSSKTRPTMLGQAAEFIRKRQVKLYDERTIGELQSFVRVDTSKIAESSPGANDDTVMALCIALSSEVRMQAMIGKTSQRRRVEV